MALVDTCGEYVVYRQLSFVASNVTPPPLSLPLGTNTIDRRVRSTFQINQCLISAITTVPYPRTTKFKNNTTRPHTLFRTRPGSIHLLMSCGERVGEVFFPILPVLQYWCPCGTLPCLPLTYAIGYNLVTSHHRQRNSGEGTGCRSSTT